MDERSSNNITKRTKARRKARDGKLDQLQTDISQILQMTPSKQPEEDLEAATALQRARAASLQHDRVNPNVVAGAGETRESWLAENQPCESLPGEVTEIFYPHHPSKIDWTREKGYVDTDEDVQDADQKVQDNPIKTKSKKSKAKITKRQTTKAKSKHQWIREEIKNQPNQTRTS